MLKRLVKDLHDSHNRLKNALELNRIQDHILKMLDILRKIGWQQFPNLLQSFCSSRWVSRLKWQHLCVNYVYNLVVRFCPTVQLPISSRMFLWSLEMGICWGSNCIWKFLKLKMRTLSLSPAMLSLTTVRDLQLQNIFEKVLFAPVLHSIRIVCCILLDFIVVLKYVQIILRWQKLRSKLKRFVKQVSIIITKIRFDNFVYMGRRKVVSPIISLSVLAKRFRTMLQFFDCIHSHKDKRWSFRSHLCQSSEVLPFCKLFKVHVSFFCPVPVSLWCACVSLQIWIWTLDFQKTFAAIISRCFMLCFMSISWYESLCRGFVADFGHLDASQIQKCGWCVLKLSLWMLLCLFLVPFRLYHLYVLLKIGFPFLISCH